jgi:Mg/Co/Ni transporter MgtE
LATGEISDSNTRFFFDREMKMGLALSGLLGLAGCFRAALFQTPFMETIAITSSLLLIVTISIFLGVLLPFGMKSLRIDPAHSSTTIQVFMDILGVWITVHVSRLVLDSDWSWLTRPVSILSDE